jgi:hypothetical protein
MNADVYAIEAERLLADDTLKYALDVVRADALEALAVADVEDKSLVLRLQQKVAVIDEFRSELVSATHRRSNAADSTGTFA